MLYRDASAWRDAPSKRVLLFGMSGLGKTHLSNLLRASGAWYHYSIDYRIGTRYMGEHIADNAKREAMKNPFLRDLLLSDSIYIGSNITFSNLAPVTAYLGVPGDPAKGGLAFGEYKRRQTQFREGEIAALLETPHFISRAGDLYGYPHFVCDTGGSICEWVDPDNPEDALLTTLADHALMVWIRGDEAHSRELVRRFDAAPKPMAYQPDFLEQLWQDYLTRNAVSESQVDPHDFLRFTYARALAHRQPRYEAMAQNWGVTVTADAVAQVATAADFEDMIAEALAAP